jgi:hypothetical protein
MWSGRATVRSFCTLPAFSVGAGAGTRRRGAAFRVLPRRSQEVDGPVQGRITLADGESLSAESENLDERLLAFHEQVAATDEVCHRLIAGECTLSRAVAELEIINSGYCSMYDAFQKMHPEASHRELTARYGIEKVLAVARESQTPTDNGVQERLEAEFREMSHGAAL